MSKWVVALVKVMENLVATMPTGRAARPHSWVLLLHHYHRRL
jgi:hypothetical protein